MPRSSSSSSKDKVSRKVKKTTDDDDDDDNNDIIEENPNYRKKSVPIPKPKDKRNRRSAEDDQEDELSDINIDDEEDMRHEETGDNDEVVSSQRTPRVRKIIDPKTPIGSLRTDDVLSYLAQVGEDTLNPYLKRGALRLLGELTGRPRYPPQQYGSKRGSYNNQSQRGYASNYNSRGRGMGGMGGMGSMNNMGRGAPRSRMSQNDNNNDLYDQSQ